jgi:hypothetical protein
MVAKCRNNTPTRPGTGRPTPATAARSPTFVSDPVIHDITRRPPRRYGCQLAILQCQVHKRKLAWPDRAVLAALLRRLPKLGLCQLPLIVSPNTVPRWRSDLPRRPHA